MTHHRRNQQIGESEDTSGLGKINLASLDFAKPGLSFFSFRCKEILADVIEKPTKNILKKFVFFFFILLTC